MVDLFSLGTQQLKLLAIYRDILDSNSSFPKYFWDKSMEPSGQFFAKCSLLTRFCFENHEHIGVASLPGYSLKDLREVLACNKLSGMLQRAFGNDVMKVLKNAYAVEFESRALCEWMWSRHGIWNDKQLVVEAVNDIVCREGITDIQDIPKVDWKKRLISNGIYNILSYFDWSIFTLFDFVYPNTFHPADFKYKLKWKTDNSMENAFYTMKKTFKSKGFSREQILLLSTAAFKRLGLAGMLATLFASSVAAAKEYYFYGTVGNPANRALMSAEIRKLMLNKTADGIKQKLRRIASGTKVTCLHNHPSLYSLIKRQAKRNNMAIAEYISSLGFEYVCLTKDSSEIDVQHVWNMRKAGLTYVQIAEKLGSNPTTISQMCLRHFGGDPLIPRPITDYTTVQDLMKKFRVDHKTIMRLVNDYNLENHTTIRFRYLKKSQIEPLLGRYVSESKQHQRLLERYAE